MRYMLNHPCRHLFAACAAIACLSGPIGAQDIYELGPDDEWSLTHAPDPSSIGAQLAVARKLLAEGRP